MVVNGGRTCDICLWGNVLLSCATTVCINTKYSAHNHQFINSICFLSEYFRLYY